MNKALFFIKRGVGGATKGQAVTYTLSDGKKIQKVREVMTGCGIGDKGSQFPL